MTERTLKTLEYDKVLTLVSEYACLKGTKKEILETLPFSDKEESMLALSKTEEAYKLLFHYGVGGVEFFDEPGDEIERAEKGASLSLAELLRCARLLKSSRIIRNSFTAIVDESITLLPDIAQSLYCDQYLEKEILSKILSDEKVADNASERLFQLRRKIAKLNDSIREKLNFYMHSADKYLQENIVTIRGDRYVIPVKNEYRSKVKGFVHDQSSTGSTVFIEPIEVLELNNQLKVTIAEEANEVEEIIRDLSHKIGMIARVLLMNAKAIIEIDSYCARAVYAYKTHSVRPLLNTRGIIDIKLGRHPLIDAKKVVPLDVRLGKDCNYLLITGPNTGGKTVTMKLVGLFTLMAMSGMFLPSALDTEVAVFNDIYCDIGDEQSIEQSLSTFSSHVKNLVEITEKANSRSFVLIDEIGAGTDPDEGGALAQAVIEKLIETGSYGIITTHYSRLKEFAYLHDGIINASMEFDSETFAPIYKINIGTPGTSNAIEIASRLGLGKEITEKATSLLSDNKISFETVLREAEKTRKTAQAERDALADKIAKATADFEEIEAEKARLSEERSKLYAQAKAESRRIINEKVDEAEDLVNQIKEILEKEEVTGGDIIKARTLKNKLEAQKYNLSEEEEEPVSMRAATIDELEKGDNVYVKSIGSYGVIDTVNPKKGECFVTVGNMKLNAKVKDIMICDGVRVKKKEEVKTEITVSREIISSFKTEINVIGMRREEALDKVAKFIDAGVLMNATELRIVHGKGQKILSSSVQAYLKKCPSVKEYRFGRYGEGENGVTIVTLK